MPTIDPSSDFIAVWFQEDEENLYLSMEVVEHSTVDPEVPNVASTASHLIGAHVNGEGEQTGCSGWGVFNVRDRYDPGADAWSAVLRIYWPMEEQDEGCGGDDFEVAADMEGNVATMTVPWSLLEGYVVAGDELTVSDARAGSGSTWPASPADYADDAPGRPFVVQYGPPVANGTEGSNDAEAPSELTAEPADPMLDAEEEGGPVQENEAPFGIFVPLLAVALALSRRTA